MTSQHLSFSLFLCCIFYLQLEKNSCFHGNSRTRERGNDMERKSMHACVYRRWGLGNNDSGTQPHCFSSVQGCRCCRDCCLCRSASRQKQNGAVTMPSQRIVGNVEMFWHERASLVPCVCVSRCVIFSFSLHELYGNSCHGLSLSALLA